MKALCIGMMVCDTLISPVPENILELDSVRIDKPRICCGGDALNVAMGLAKLGCPVSIIGRIGRDSNGSFILKECQQNHIDSSRVIFDQECGTAASYALIDTNGERHFLTEKSVFYRISGTDVSDGRFLIQMRYISDLRWLFRKWMKAEYRMYLQGHIVWES